MLRLAFKRRLQAWMSTATHTTHCVPLSTRASDDIVVLDLKKQQAPRNVLVVGDGNFSYSKALAGAFIREGITPTTIIATSLDTQNEIDTMYPGASSSISALKAAGARVLHGVNATSLGAHKASFGVHSGFDRIVFNFPHFAEGGNTRNKISKHRTLLTEFFQSCQSVLAPHGQIWVALCQGQGGSPADTLKRNEGDTWQVVPCAAAGQMILLDVVSFPYAELSLLGYHSVGYRLQDRAFHSEGGLIHIFGPESPSTGKPARFAQSWTRHISFWRGDGYSLDALQVALQEVLGPGVGIALTLHDTYHCNKTNRTSLTFHVTFESRVHNFSRQRLNDIVHVIAQKLAVLDVGIVRS